MQKKTKSKERKKRITDDKKMELVMDCINKKKSFSSIASECNVSEQTVRNWVEKYQNSKSCSWFSPDPV